MKTKTLTKALLISSVLTVGALGASAASAAVASRGNYLVGGIQDICLKSDGTWYGEDFAGWSGTWGAGPTKEDATILHGNYLSGYGNDSMNIKGQTVDWFEWRDDESVHFFLATSFVKTSRTCTPPPARATTRHNPMD